MRFLIALALLAPLASSASLAPVAAAQDGSVPGATHDPRLGGSPGPQNATGGEPFFLPGPGAPTLLSPGKVRPHDRNSKLTWAGRLREVLDSESQRVLRMPLTDRVAGDLVDREADRILLLYEADRDYDKARGRMGVLWVRVAKRDNAAAVGLERVHRLRYELALAAGDWETFERVDGPYPGLDLIQFFIDATTVDSTGPDSDLLQALEAEPALRALRERGRELRSASEGRPLEANEDSYREYIERTTPYPGEDLENLLLDMMWRKDFAGLRSMGAPAFAVIASHVLYLVDSDRMTLLEEYVDEAFEYLVLLDQSQALGLFVDWFPVAGATWRQRVFEACLTEGALQWLPSNGMNGLQERRNSRLWDPQWQELLALFLGDDRIARQSGELLETLAMRDGFGEPLQAAIGTCLASNDRLLAATILDAVDFRGRALSAAPALVRGLESKHVDVRKACIGLLTRWGAQREARLGLRDPEASVRTLALESLAWAEVDFISEDSNYRKRSVHLPVSSEELVWIERMLGDEATHAAAAEAVPSMELTVDLFPQLLGSVHPELRREASRWVFVDQSKRGHIDQLLADPDPSVRWSLLGYVGARSSIRTWSTEEWFRILTTLVVDPDPEVRSYADLLLAPEKASRRALGEDTYRKVLAAIVPVRFAINNESPQFQKDGPNGWGEWANGWGLELDTDPWLFDFAIDNRIGELIAQQLEEEMGEWGRYPVGPGFVALRKLSPERRLALYGMDLSGYPVKHWESGGASPWRTRLLRDAPTGAGPDIEVLRMALARGLQDEAWVQRSVAYRSSSEEWAAFCGMLVADEAMPWDLRVRAAVGADLSASEGGLGLYWQLFEGAPVREDTMLLLGEVVAAMASPEAAYLASLDRIESSADKASFAIRVVETLGLEHAAGLQRTLAEFGFAGVASEVADDCVYMALGILSAGRPDDTTMALVVALAKGTRFAGQTCDVLVQDPTREHLDLVFAMLDEPRFAEAQMDALFSLQGCLADEAFEGLRMRIQTMPRKLREKAMEVLAQMGESRKVILGLQSVQLPSRDQAIAELLEMLKHQDPAVRAAAAKGVGGFGALEALPTLIRLLGTETDTTVKAAVNAAIGRLTATEPGSD
ncbi:MAG: HEAT repeat domain-containing protein [Planctomycetota bacterium]|nr:HEAT repeat domain-containing protein [Planctomycetota bacterium]